MSVTEITTEMTSETWYVVSVSFETDELAREFAWFVHGAEKYQLCLFVRRVNCVVDIHSDFWDTKKKAHDAVESLLMYFKANKNGHDGEVEEMINTRGDLGFPKLSQQLDVQQDICGPRKDYTNANFYKWARAAAELEKRIEVMDAMLRRDVHNYHNCKDCGNTRCHHIGEDTPTTCDAYVWKELEESDG
jgi:hypothetical protein